jgi:hypothetical protein
MGLLAKTCERWRLYVNLRCYAEVTEIGSARVEGVCVQWRTQEFFQGGGVRQEFFSGGVQQIQLRTEGIENGDLVAVAP